MPIKTVPFDAAEFITSAEGQADLLNDALESGNAGYIANALGVIARARGMSEVARSAGVTREALYKALTEGGDPKLTTIVKVMGALDLKLTAATTTGRPRRRVGSGSRRGAAKGKPASRRMAKA